MSTRQAESLRNDLRAFTDSRATTPVLFLLCPVAFPLLFLNAWAVADTVRSCGLDPSLACGALMEGPPAPIVSTSVSSPEGSHKEEPCKRFFKREKSGNSSLALQPVPYWLARASNGPAFLLEVRSRGITHKAESNSNCLGQATVVLVRWTFQPVAALIVGHVSSGS